MPRCKELHKDLQQRMLYMIIWLKDVGSVFHFIIWVIGILLLGQYALPRFKLCSLKFLHMILEDKKKVVKNDRPKFKMPHSKLFSTEHLISNGFIKAEVV